jgi:hypothetical protein
MAHSDTHLVLIDPATKEPFPSLRLTGLAYPVFVLPEKTSFWIRVVNPASPAVFKCFLEDGDIGCTYAVPGKVDHFDFEGFYSFDESGQTITPFCTAKPELDESVVYSPEEEPAIGNVVVEGTMVKFCSDDRGCHNLDTAIASFTAPPKTKLNCDTSYREGLTSLAKGEAIREERYGGCMGHPLISMGHDRFVDPPMIYYTSPPDFERLARRYS